LDRFEAWNMHITGMDFCTGSRFVSPIPSQGKGDLFLDLATGFMKRLPCPRTMAPAFPGHAAAALLEAAKQSGAKGVMGLTLKFCDPYLARIPLMRQELQKASLPLLALESDCTPGAVEQHRTRIEAFTEMLGGNR
ncbi:MAG: 2-hydroxyacyl-CoA dehydratase family protein, partial [Pseudomonadota bacterium]